MSGDLSGKRILVVEDEMIVAWALQDSLVGFGCTVVGPATRVNQALAMIDAETFDAAILDVNLNGQKSYPIADVLTARGMPFLFSTGYDKGGIGTGYQDMPRLQKPYSSAKLLEAVEHLLEPNSTTAPRQKSLPPVWDAQRLRVATDAGGIALWSWNVDTGEVALDERAHRLWGVQAGSVTFEDLSARIHPEDVDRVRLAFSATREVQGSYEVEFRILHGEDVRWISARGMGEDQGIVGRVMFGVFLDVSERKFAEETRELLASEMAHRIKNLFSIASALTNISARSTATSAEMRVDLTQRLTALSLAHDLVQPVLDGPGRAASLSNLMATLLAPYVDEGSLGNRVNVSVPDLPVGESSARALALIVHELATNSIKYGALSRPTGTLHISCLVHGEEVTITWSERGGPAVTAPEGPVGFGSQLIRKSIANQLGGSATFDWHTEGLLVTLRMNKARL